MLKYDKYEVIIFDLGNTILPISPQQTIMAFHSLGFSGNILQPPKELSLLLSHYQKGCVDSFSFLEQIKTYLAPNVTKEQIIEAWNAMLLEFPPEYIALLKRLKETHQLILLSNTNDLHTLCFEAKAKAMGFSLTDYFNKIYYSHKLGLSKPNKEIYDYVYTENNLSTKKVLFLDDLEENLIIPQNIGWDISLVSEKRTILNYL